MNSLVDYYRNNISVENEAKNNGEMLHIDAVEDMLLACSFEVIDKISDETLIFENIVEAHSMQPEEVLYNSNAMCGEAGEVANIAKKMQFEDLMPQWVGQGILSKEELKDKIADELGDVLFYLTRLALDNGFTLDHIIKLQIQKLKRQSKIYGRKFLK